MRLLIDANILIDVLSKREPYFHHSSLIWKLCETQNVNGFVSALSFANIAYIMRKELKPETIEKTFQMMKLIFQFTDLSMGDISRAIEMKWKDFEDSVQNRLNCYLTPTEYLKKYNNFNNQKERYIFPYRNCISLLYQTPFTTPSDIPPFSSGFPLATIRALSLPMSPDGSSSEGFSDNQKIPPYHPHM